MPYWVSTEAEARKAVQKLAAKKVDFVAAGRRADFVVLDANPLDDIRNTRRISDVYIRGATVDRAAMRAK